MADNIAADLQALMGFMQRVFLNAAGRTRPWGSMFSPLQLPKDWAEYERRLHANGLYYASNYLVITLLVSFIMIWSNWRLLFAYAVLIPVAAYCYGVRWSRGSLGRSSSSSKVGQERIVLGVGALIWLWLTGCILSTLLLVAVSFLTVILHATLRPATVSGSLRARMASAADGVRAAFATPPAGSTAGGDEDDGGDDFIVRSAGEAFRALLGMGKRRRGGSSSSGSGGGRAAGDGGAAAAAMLPSGRSSKKGSSSSSSAAQTSLEEAATPASSDIEGSFPSGSAPAAAAWGAAPAAGHYDATSLHGHHGGGGHGGVSPAGGEDYGSAYAAPAPALHSRRGPQLPPSSGAPLPRPSHVRSD